MAKEVQSGQKEATQPGIAEVAIENDNTVNL